MRKSILCLFAVPALCCPLTIYAAGMMKQGLWEMTIKSDAMKNMPQISPEQMEMMRQKGINVPQMQGGAMVTKVCVSKEMADRDQPPAVSRSDSGCQPKNFQRSGSGYSADIVCTGPRLQGQGSVKGTFSGSDSFSSTYDFKGTAQGHPVNTHQETSGKWVGADCGSVQPPPMAK